MNSAAFNTAADALIAAMFSAPKTNTGATYTQVAGDNNLIANAAAAQTITLLNPALCTGQSFTVKTTAAFAVVSLSANVVPMAGGAAGTAILAAIAGKWAKLVSDGINWIIMEAN
jgi:hypothetical protein